MMSSGEFLTRSTIWISVAAYAIGLVLFALRRISFDKWTRLAWTIGCAALLAHFASAFHFYHSWSHSSAYVETARQTNDVFGINFGGGVFVNYAVALLWLGDVTWWWLAGLDSYRQRPLWIRLIWHAFLIFIIFNGTVVFAHGSTRSIGLGISLILSLSWIFIIRQRPLHLDGY